MGAPPESISLGARISGYRLSLENRGLDRLKLNRLIGNLEADLDGIVILLEPGEPLKRDDPALRNFRGYRQPCNLPLRGAQ